jgi:hypothetical protein
MKRRFLVFCVFALLCALLAANAGEARQIKGKTKAFDKNLLACAIATDGSAITAQVTMERRVRVQTPEGEDFAFIGSFSLDVPEGQKVMVAFLKLRSDTRLVPKTVLAFATDATGLTKVMQLGVTAAVTPIDLGRIRVGRKLAAPEFNPLEAVDNDADGASDFADDDDDNDSLADGADTDADGNGTLDLAEDLNADDDRRPDVVDADDDNDGVGDRGEADDDGDGTPDWDGDTDADDDSIEDVDDPDDDNDGIEDAQDNDQDGDTIPDMYEEDSDGDLVPDDCDNDDDNDGITDDQDEDNDGDGTLDQNEQDQDGDGVPDDCDEDEDGDRIPDYQDN